MTTITLFLDALETLPLGVRILVDGMMMTLYIIFIMCLAGVSCIASPKFVRHPYEDQLERTDRVWLSIVSPFHTLSDEKYDALLSAETDSSWIWCVRDILVMSIIAVLEVALLVSSIVGGAVWLTFYIVGVTSSAAFELIRDILKVIWTRAE